VGTRHTSFLARLRIAGRTAQPVTPVERCLRRATPLVAGSRWQVALLLAFHRSLRAATPVMHRTGRHTLRVERTIVLRDHHALQREASRLHTQVVSVLVHRVALSSRSPAPATRTNTPAAASPRDVPRLALTMVRTHAPADRPTEVDRARPPTRSPARSPDWDGRLQQVTASPLPAQELSRVTEHVLRTLDRRVLSWRERSGQV